MLVSLLNDANEFFRSRLCAPTLSRLTQTRLQIQSPDLKLKIALFRLFPIALVSFLNYANEFLRSRLCAPTLSSLTQTRFQINLPWSPYRKRPPPE